MERGKEVCVCSYGQEMLARYDIMVEMGTTEKGKYRQAIFP